MRSLDDAERALPLELKPAALWEKMRWNPEGAMEKVIGAVMTALDDVSIFQVMIEWANGSWTARGLPSMLPLSSPVIAPRRD